MRRKLTLSIDEEVYRRLKSVPRGFSVSEFVSFMLKAMLKEFRGNFSTQEEFEKWVAGDPQLERVREGIKEAWGPTLFPVIDKIDAVTDKMKANVGIKTRLSKGGPKK
jgi:predicted CopG family antitoxin